MTGRPLLPLTAQPGLRLTDRLSRPPCWPETPTPFLAPRGAGAGWACSLRGPQGPRRSLCPGEEAGTTGGPAEQGLVVRGALLVGTGRWGRGCRGEAGGPAGQGGLSLAPGGGQMWGRPWGGPEHPRQIARPAPMGA